MTVMELISRLQDKPGLSEVKLCLAHFHAFPLNPAETIEEFSVDLTTTEVVITSDNLITGTTIYLTCEGANK